MTTAEIGTSDPGSWEREYNRGGIPSSVREGPSSSVRDFVAFAATAGVTQGYAIDVGCGSGRNSLYLAELGFHVTGIDYAASQVDRLDAAARELGLSTRLRSQCHDVRSPWPVEHASQKLAIDAFCFKHQIAHADIDAYVKNAATAVAPGGLMMVSFAGRGDGYYAQFPIEDDGGAGRLILDPGNQILSRLYDWNELATLFQPFTVVHHATKLGRNEMHGQAYDRETHVVYLKRV